MNENSFDKENNDDYPLHELFGEDQELYDEEFPKEDVTTEEDEQDEVQEIDFSEFSGDFRSGMKAINRKLKKAAKKKKLTKRVPVQHRATIYGKSHRKMGKVLVPRDRKVIVEGVSKFILSTDKADEATKNIGYYKGKKLRELLITFNNDSALDFNLELFNPSMPLDYLYSTSLNINDKVQIGGAGSGISYTDVLFNLLANPTLIPNAKFVIAGPSLVEQMSQSLIFKNKNIEAKQKIVPYQMSLQKDTMQVQNDIIYFDIMGGINRPFIPDGMDVIQYKILAGMTVTFCFYYKQKNLKKVLFKEAAENKILLP